MIRSYLGSVDWVVRACNLQPGLWSFAFTAVVSALWAAPVSALTAPVAITEADYEGRAQFVIHTESATWFYDRAGGGISRLIDRSGRDWVAFSKSPLSEFPASAAAGYRGLGNMLFGTRNPDAGGGHPGFDQCVSEIAGPGRIRTRSHSGKWQWSWTFTETTATFAMELADPEHPWWFLYEGPVAGRFAPAEQIWGTSEGGPKRDVPDLRNQRFGQWRWAYFGDRGVDRVLFIAQHEPDDLTDTFWYLGSSKSGATTAPDGMVVFGFGRGPGTQPLLRGAGQRFTAGLLELGVDSEKDHAAVAERIEQVLTGQIRESARRAWHRDLTRIGATLASGARPIATGTGPHARPEDL
jgi:hypothetical protein